MSESETYPRLVGDIGGTNARFACLSHPGAALSEIDQLPADDHPSLLDAIQVYLTQHGLPRIRWCALGIANPVTGDAVQMTNRNWSFSISELKRQLGVERLLVINDFTALALALPALAAGDVRQVGPGAPVPNAPCGLIGPGTGLGVSGLFPSGTGHPARAIEGEGGHVTLAGSDAREDAVIAVLRRKHGHASAERALSGPGLENLYGALCELGGIAALPFCAAEISTLALADADPQCSATIDLFLSLLGSVAGNLALTLGARGGVYIGGGIVPRLGERIDRSRFRAQFESKGRFRNYLSAIPTYVVQASVSPGLLGAARALERP